MTLENLKARREKALALLDAHTDEYRVFYSKVTGIKDLSSESLESLKLERAQLSIKSEVIHTQLKYLDELINYENSTVNTTDHA